jgi:replicative DNA helicase
MVKRRDYEMLIFAAAFVDPTIIDRIDLSILKESDKKAIEALRDGNMSNLFTYLPKEEVMEINELTGKLFRSPAMLQNLVSSAYENLVIEDSIDRLYKAAVKAQELLLFKDLDGARELLTTEANSTSFGLSLRPIVSDLKDSLKETSGFFTGFDAIDDAGGMYRGNLATIIGDSGGMKTMISLYMCLEILQKNPTFTCLYFEKEMPVKDIARRLIAYITKQPLSKIAEIAYSKSERDIEVMSDVIDTAYQGEYKSLLDRIFIVPHNKFKTAYHMQAFVNRYKPDIWVLDYFTMLEQPDDRMSSYDYFSQQATILKQTALQSNSLGIILGQLKQNALNDKAKKIPDFGDAEFSSKLKQYSAYAWCTFYPKLYYTENYANSMYFYLLGLKNRNGAVINMFFDAYPDYCVFKETANKGHRDFLEVYKK